MFAASSPVSTAERNGALALADLLECSLYAIQQRAADPDASVPDLDNNVLLNHTALVVAESLRLLLALASGADLVRMSAWCWHDAELPR